LKRQAQRDREKKEKFHDEQGREKRRKKNKRKEFGRTSY
jgi:hypothetical protein